MQERKGILLAGGLGTRLSPATLAINKQLFPVYDKPMIYYPLSLLMMAGIKKILVISNPNEIIHYRKLLGNGSAWGVTITHTTQKKPKGIAESFLIAEEFIGKSPVTLALGDNILYGDALPQTLLKAATQTQGATIFGYMVKNPRNYGILTFDHNWRVVHIEEKPQQPTSNYAVIGIYFYDNAVVPYAKSLKPSLRGELEITDINRMYLSDSQLKVQLLGRGMAWLDAGTPDSLLDAANFIRSLEERQGLKICCPEEIAWRQHYIDDRQLIRLAQRMGNCDYATYLLSLPIHQKMPQPLQCQPV